MPPCLASPASATSEIASTANAATASVCTLRMFPSLDIRPETGRFGADDTMTGGPGNRLSRGRYCYFGLTKGRDIPSMAHGGNRRAFAVQQRIFARSHRKNAAASLAKSSADGFTLSPIRIPSTAFAGSCLMVLSAPSILAAFTIECAQGHGRSADCAVMG